MLYHSTRNSSLTASSAQAVLEGLAPDGGLYMPSRLPAFDWKACLAGDSQAMATAILSALLPDIPDMENLVILSEAQRSRRILALNLPESEIKCVDPSTRCARSG